jgi:dienelactone hydrolase
MRRKVKLEPIGDHQVFTVLSEPDSPTDKLVIMAHGFRGNSTGPARSFVNFETALIEDGFSCLRFDQPCSGNSTGDYAESSFNLWVETIAYLTTRHQHAGLRVALLGQSTGATAVMAAASRPALTVDVPCVLLWVPGLFDDWVDSTTGELEEEEGQLYPPTFWSEARDARFVECVASYPGGIHLVYGERDRFTSESQRRRAVDAVSRSPGNEVMVLEDEDHSSWRYASAQRVFEAQRAFLKRYV